MTPTYSPGGDMIYFASNRVGRRMSIWQVAATGTPPIMQKTADANDLWPSIDSDPQPKMYYESRIDARTEPRLFSKLLGTATQTDLTRIGGGEPRVSPRNDQVLFSSANDKTGKRDLFVVPATGGTAQKLTDTPDVDECNPVWDRDGSRIAFASDAGKDPDGRHNYDIWVMDMKDPKHPKQLTTNPSRDDLPVWDPTGRSIFFRSNRGSEWGIWRMQVK
jgi:TolB protein